MENAVLHLVTDRLGYVLYIISSQPDNERWEVTPAKFIGTVPGG